jgi:hypothetical protein
VPRLAHLRVILLLANVRFICEPTLYFPNIDHRSPFSARPSRRAGNFFKILDCAAGLRMGAGGR